MILGIPLGVALGTTRSWEQTWQPAIESMYAVPKTMLYPIFILLFGVGIGSRISIAFSHALLPIVSSAMTSAAARSSSIVTALAPAVRASLSLAFIGVVLSEMYASTQGLGLLLMLSARERDGVNRVLAIILLLFLLLLLVNISFRALEKRLQTNAEPK